MCFLISFVYIICGQIHRILRFFIIQEWRLRVMSSNILLVYMQKENHLCNIEA
ncbi:unnamed protein product [Arabidopsis halleri]